jgi:nitroreductase
MSNPSQSEAPELHLPSVDRVLGTARSVRRKLDFTRPVEPQVLYDCINLSAQAPTGLRGESWRFVVVTEPAPKARLAALYRATLMDLVTQRGIPLKDTQRALVDRLHEVPAMIFVGMLGPPPGAEVAAQVAFYGSVLPAAWSLMLALRSRELGATWTTLLSSRQTELREILEVPEPVVFTVMLPVGYLKDARLRRAERRDASEITFWNRWGNPAP